MLPSLQLLATDILDRPQAPLGRMVAEEGVEGPWSGANLALVKTEVISITLKDMTAEFVVERARRRGTKKAYMYS